MNFKLISILLIVFVLSAFGLQNNIQKKVDKEIKDVFGIEKFTFTSVSISENVTKELPSKFGPDNFFSIKTNSNLIGYAYLSQAPSKTAQFDYLVLLDKNLIVTKTKVLAYREEYGGEIGSTRWLRQFQGKTTSDDLKYGDNIIAISGATISVRSMTNAMNNLLHSLKILQSKKAI